MWEVLNRRPASSVFEQTWYEFELPPDAELLRERWTRLRALRSDVQKQLEALRVAGKVGSSLAGEVALYANGAETKFLQSFDDDLRFVFITSQARIRDDDPDGAADPASRDQAQSSAESSREMRTVLALPRGRQAPIPSTPESARGAYRTSLVWASRVRMRKWLSLSAAIVALDQATKALVAGSFSLHESVEITPFFNMVLVYNRGAAFSLLSDATGWQRGFFIAIAIAASGWIAWLLRRHAADILFCLALSLVLGGALGNLIDRLHIGAVLDFLDFHAFGYHWPAFNVADIAISCGAVLLVWDALRPKKHPAAA